MKKPIVQAGSTTTKVTKRDKKEIKEIKGIKMSNVFEDFQEKKKQILNVTNQAAEYGWLTKERANEIRKKIENDILTIGVIGQMKCGKSTFLNAFVFEDDVLPSATTPMTASLSVITYGTEKKIKAEFYTADEWAEQKSVAARDLESAAGNELEISKITAAKELVEKSAKLGNSLQSYLGTTKEDSFDKLEDYVGADGKYVSITKAVKIYYPKDYLKGVEIVDTPGMNDPIVSREERTKDFLKKADVVLMMLYAGRPFDATDHAILFENVRKCGTGKVLIGINKYDIPYEQGESEDEIREYVEEEIRKACQECKDDTISEIMKEVTPVLLSANMALLSELPMSKISSRENYKFDWERYCDRFEISSQPQFREKSHIDELSKQVINLIENEKGRILFLKPKNEIVAAGENKKVEIEKEISDTKNKKTILLSSDSELEEKLNGLAKADKKMNRKLERFAGKFKDIFGEKLRGIASELEDCVADACKRMKKDVEDFKGNLEKLRLLLPEAYLLLVKNSKGELEKLRQTLESTINQLRRDLKRILSGKNGKIKNELRESITSYFNDISEVVNKYISDFDVLDFWDALKQKVILSIDEEVDSFSFNDIFSKSGNFWEELPKGFFQKKNAKLEISGKIVEMEKDFSEKDLKNFCVNIDRKADSIIEEIKKETVDEIIDSLRGSIEECKNDKSSKDEKVKQLEDKLASLADKKSKLNQQIEKIKALVSA